MIYEYRGKKFMHIQDGKPREIPNQTMIRFLGENDQRRPILAFNLFLAGREAIFSDGILRLLGGEPFQFGASWLGEGIRFEIV